MNWKANYYGIRGQRGFVHSHCLSDFQEAHTVYDALGRAARWPIIEIMVDKLGSKENGPCLHCKRQLTEGRE